MSPENLGMLVCLSIDHRRIYVGNNGVELVGYRSGTSRLRPLWLWLRGYLTYSARIPWRQYGWPGVYLVLSPVGREWADKIKDDVARWRKCSVDS